MELPIEERDGAPADVRPARDGTGRAPRAGGRVDRRRAALVATVAAGLLAALAATTWPGASAAGGVPPAGQARDRADKAPRCAESERLPGRGPGFVVTDEGIVVDARTHPAAATPTTARAGALPCS